MGSIGPKNENSGYKHRQNIAKLLVNNTDLQSDSVYDFIVAGSDGSGGGYNFPPSQGYADPTYGYSRPIGKFNIVKSWLCVLVVANSSLGLLI